MKSTLALLKMYGNTINAILERANSIFGEMKEEHPNGRKLQQCKGFHLPGINVGDQYMILK